MYPDDPNGLVSTGFFTEEGKTADEARSRLAAIAMQWFNRCQIERQKQERQWYLNLAFYNGNQHVQFRQIQGGGPFDLQTPKAPYYRVRIVINKVRQVIRKEISRLTAQKPNAYVIPASTEDADVFAAQAAEQIWDSLWRRLRFNKTLREAIFWQAVCGTGFIKAYWDPTKKDPELPPESEGLANPGDICIHHVTPFHIFVPDLLATDIEDQAYIIHAIVKDNSWIKNNFGIDSGSEVLNNVDDALQNVMGVTRNDSKKTQSVILEVWVKPGYLPELPNGGMFTVVQNKIVQGLDSWPYQHGRYPFVKIDAMPTGKFYAASIIEDLIPIQKELNRKRAQIIEAANKMAKPQLVAEKGSIEPKMITSEPGQILLHNPGFNPPQPLPMQGLPSYVTEELNRAYSDISDMSGQHEVSNGGVPPGVTAATAISFLQEQDESLIATQYTSLEEAIEAVAAMAISYVQTYWDEARVVKIVGIEGTFDVQVFKGADLRGNTDIRIEAGSALPNSRAAKQAFLMDLMKMGFIPPEKGLELMEIGGLNKLYEQLQIDKRQAQRENLKMKVVTEEDVQSFNEAWMAGTTAGTDANTPLKLEPPLIVPTHTWDNHQLHIEVHNNYRKSQNFENASPLTKRLFEEHVRQHQDAIANMMIHPLTGMDPSNPQAPDPEMEQDVMDSMNGDPSGEQATTGPVPMPEMSDSSM